MTILFLSSTMEACAKGSASMTTRRRAMLSMSTFSDRHISRWSRTITIHRSTYRDPSPTIAEHSHIGDTAATASTASSSRSRWISSTPILHDGELAEHCDQHVVSSPCPPISQSWDQPLPDFVMAKWRESSKSSSSSSSSSNSTNDDLAIFDGSTGMKRTFGDYYDDTTGIAGSLRHDLGIDATSCVCLFAPNHVDYLPITLAVGLCGAKLTPVNPLYKSQELAVVLQKSRSSVLIAHTSNREVAVQAAREASSVQHVLILAEDGEAAHDGLETLESIKRHPLGFDATSDSYHCDAKSHAYLLPYSSGTTGLPKGVCLTHSNITVNLLQKDVVEGPTLNPGAGLFSPLPFFHIYGLVASMMYYGWKGHPLYTMSGRFDFELMLEMIQKHKATHAHLVPPIILGLAKSPLVDQFDLSSLQTIISAASPLGSDTESAAQKRLGCNVKQAWGMSELSPLGTITDTSNMKVGSVGQLVSNTLGKIIDNDTGKSLGPNEEGELVIKGPQVMMGYLDEDEKTKECLSSSGWLRTGDLAKYDDDGFFTITDRIKELIKVRGYQVAPAELEDLLLGHDAIIDAAVIQIPDDNSGELPLAYIVLKEFNDDEDDNRTPETIKSEIYEWVKDRVAPYKRLDGGITFVDSIPKSASGKILRRILRDELAEQLKV